MEGHSVEEEDKHPLEYTTYQPVSFDGPEGGETAAGLPVPRDPAESYRSAHAERVGGETDAAGEAFTASAHNQVTGTDDIASLQFQRENTLLTNAESYAASIKEEAQLYVRQLREEVESLNAEAEKRYEEAANLKAEAEAEAARMIAEAQAQVDDIRENARKEGHDAGLEEGLARRYEEAGGSLETLEKSLAEINQFRKRVAYYTENDGIRLAMIMAKKILNAELKINKQAIMRLLAQSLSKLEGKGTFRVWLSPEDHEFALAARPSLQRFLDETQTLTLRAKPDLERGNVLIETDREVIDLTFDSQFYHLDQTLRQALAEREAAMIQSLGTTGDRPEAAPAAQPPQPSQPTPPAGAGDEG